MQVIINSSLDIQNEFDNLEFQERSVAFSSIKMGKELNEEQTSKFFSLIKRYGTCFAEDLSQLGTTNAIEMEITLNDECKESYKPEAKSNTISFAGKLRRYCFRTFKI